MDKIILILLISILLLFIFTALGFFILYKVQKDKIEEMQETTKEQTEEMMNQFANEPWKNNMLLKQQDISTTLMNIDKMYSRVQDQLDMMNEKNISSSQVLSDMSSHISSMNDIMVNKKSRGNWGEYQLQTLLSTYAGESQKIFEVQYPLKNGYIGDVALHLPGNTKVLMIDSKFPMENFRDMQEENPDVLKKTALFKQNIKKHVNDISKKYITAETVDLAVMFIPSEAVYYTVCADYPELIDYAHNQHVLITSPTTLIGVVFTLINATKDYNRSQNLKDIEKHIVAMQDDTKRLVTRLEKVQTASDSLAKALKEAKTSADKIDRRVDKVSQGVVDENLDKKVE